VTNCLETASGVETHQGPAPDSGATTALAGGVPEAGTLSRSRWEPAIAVACLLGIAVLVATGQCVDDPHAYDRVEAQP
jgi:hypothetical protein